MQTKTGKLRKLRLAIIITSIAALLSFFSPTVTVFAYGMLASTTFLFLLLYPLFIVSTVLVVAKVRLGYYMAFLIAITYAILLSNEVGEYLVFNFYNTVLFWVLLLPYLCSLALIPTTLIYLSDLFKYKREFKLTSILLAVGLLIYPIAVRYNKDYTDRIFVDAEITEQGQVILNCKPGFADSREFVMTATSKDLEEQIKKHGEFYQGSYFLQNTRIRKNFRFNKLKSVTLTDFGDTKITPEPTWTAKEIKGDTNFLLP